MLQRDLIILPNQADARSAVLHYTISRTFFTFTSWVNLNYSKQFSSGHGLVVVLTNAFLIVSGEDLSRTASHTLQVRVRALVTVFNLRTRFYNTNIAPHTCSVSFMESRVYLLFLFKQI